MSSAAGDGMFKIFDFMACANDGCVAAIGVPLKLLHDGSGHIVTVELKNGEVYRGLLAEVEDTMNCQLKEGTFPDLRMIAFSACFVLFSHHDCERRESIQAGQCFPAWW